MRNTGFTLMANNHVGVRGRENLGLRLRELQKVLSNDDWKQVDDLKEYLWKEWLGLT